MKKIEELISRIENFLSALILNFWGIICFPFVKLFSLIIPFVFKIKELCSDLLRSIVQGFLSFVQVLNSMVGPRAWNYYRHKIKNFVEQVQKDKAEKVKLKDKNISNTVGVDDNKKSSKKSFFEEFGSLFDAFIDRLGKISPLRFAIMGFLFLVILLNSFHFLSSSNDLAITIKEDTSSKIQRSLASSLEAIPPYYNDLARLSDMKGLKIPAYTSSIDKIKNLELDAFILFYNSSGKQFFDRNVIIFIDHLSLSLEPVMPQFPLTPEGKMILKEKIKNEITSLLHKEGIESSVEEVFFTNIFAN